MNKTILKSSVSAAAVLIAMNSALAQTTDASVERIASGDAVVAFEMYWPERKAQDVSARTATLASIMTGAKIEQDTLTQTLTRSTQGSRTSFEALDGAPQLAFAYLPDFDEIRLANRELLASPPLTGDIGESQAVAVASGALKKMADAGLLEAADFNPDLAQVGYRKVGGGSIDGVQEYEHIVEYRVTFRRSLNGIEMANSGVRIGVHASGDISSLRLGGVAVERVLNGGLSLHTGRGAVKARSVSRDAIETRFAAEQPKDSETRLAFSKMMYVMPEDTARAVVLPTEVFSFSLAFDTDEGATSVSRRQVVGYDVTDAKSPARNYTSPVAAATNEPVRTR